MCNCTHEIACRPRRKSGSGSGKVEGILGKVRLGNNVDEYSKGKYVCGKARKQQLLLNILIDGVLCIFMVEHRFSISPLEYFSDESLIPNRIEYMEQILGISLYSRNTNSIESNWP